MTAAAANPFGFTQASPRIRAPSPTWPFGSASSFGASGSGGCLGVADPAAGVRYAYVTNQSRREQTSPEAPRQPRMRGLEDRPLAPVHQVGFHGVAVIVAHEVQRAMSSPAAPTPRPASPRSRAPLWSATSRGGLRSKSSPLDLATTRTSPRNYPGSCSQREPKRAKVICARGAELRRVVCRSLAVVLIAEGLITQRSLVQIQPPQPATTRG